MSTTKNQPRRQLRSTTLPKGFTVKRSFDNIEQMLLRAMQPDVSHLYKRASFALTHLERIKIALRQLAVVLMLTFALLATAQADDRHRDRCERRELHNYIIERQQIGAVQGVPTSRMIIGRREIDIYPNGLMFEGNNVVGVRGH